MATGCHVTQHKSKMQDPHRQFSQMLNREEILIGNSYFLCLEGAWCRARLKDGALGLNPTCATASVKASLVLKHTSLKFQWFDIIK